MQYRYAHHMLLLVLLPAILFAFWPHYFGRIVAAPFAFHAHGLTATAWILLVAGQSWTIHARNHALHRTLGRLIFVAVPLFVAGAALAFQSMAAKYVAQSDPFYAALGPLLGLDDLISTTAFVLLARAALAQRRRPALHGGYLLGTVLLVVPPIVARLNLPVSPAWHAGEVIAALPALVLALRSPKQAAPFLVVLGVLALKVAADTALGFDPAWIAVFTAALRVPAAVLALVPAGLAFAVLWFTWHPVKRRPAAAASRAPAPAADDLQASRR